MKILSRKSRHFSVLAWFYIQKNAIFYLLEIYSLPDPLNLIPAAFASLMSALSPTGREGL